MKDHILHYNVHAALLYLRLSVIAAENFDDFP